MKESDIKLYTEQTLKELRQAASYPCNTENMKYDVYTHKYYLTPQALLGFGLDVETQYISSAQNKIQRFIEEVTEDVYGVIDFLAPFNIMYCYCLAAQSYSYQFRDKYTARNQFERALLYQAKYKLENIDVRDLNGLDMEGGTNQYIKALRKEGRHVSPRTVDILDKLGLLYNGNDVPKYMDFERYM